MHFHCSFFFFYTSPLITCDILIKWSSTTFARWYVGYPSLFNKIWSPTSALLKDTFPRMRSSIVVVPCGTWEHHNKLNCGSAMMQDERCLPTSALCAARCRQVERRFLLWTATDTCGRRWLSRQFCVQCDATIPIVPKCKSSDTHWNSVQMSNCKPTHNRKKKS